MSQNSVPEWPGMSLRSAIDRFLSSPALCEPPHPPCLHLCLEPFSLRVADDLEHPDGSGAEGVRAEAGRRSGRRRRCASRPAHLSRCSA